MQCAVCQTEIPAENVTKFVSWHLCELHADLAIHASKHVTDAVAELGIDVALQSAIAEAGQGIFQAYRALGSIAKRGQP